MIFVMILNILTDLWDTFLDFIEPLTSFLKETWSDLNTFLLKYMSQDVMNILAFGIVVAIILIVVLAVINNKN